MNLMVTTNQIALIDTQNIRRKKYKHNIKESHQVTREENKRRNQNYKNNQKTINKMAISTYLSTIYFKSKWTKCSNQKTQSG